ncbi:RGD1562079 (predicted) [Rattus norvegicus]|uniref:RGD1562079 (Predicted) n=1 Tax=Rattus norvegicus TaxID=10116 RepID=A6J9W4_RAT|nr:RGD1562079 (predicted) [Rattus norvegicus]
MVHQGVPLNMHGKKAVFSALKTAKGRDV